MMRVHEAAAAHSPPIEITGNGHHGIDFVGVASVWSGKGLMYGSTNQASLTRVM